MAPSRSVQYTDDELGELGLTRAALVPQLSRVAHDEPRRVRLLRTARALVDQHASAARILLPLLGVAALLHGWNMLHSPGPNDDEATYASQAWAVEKLGELSHYTYWYDHPPLGWLLLTAWNLLLEPLPGPLDRLVAGRVAMLLVHLAACALMFLLARRMALPRWAAAVAVVLFTFSPLGLEWQRLTLLDNIGTPFILGSWALALSPRRRLSAYVGSGLALAAAVLVKETNALFVLPIAVHLWMVLRGHNRRYGLTLFFSAFVGFSLIYPLFAVLKNELFPGPGHVSLVWAIEWQLFERASSGSALNPASGAHLAVMDWISRDGPLLIGGLAAALVAWLHKPARPLLGLYLLLAATPLRNGYLPSPFPINLVWPAALLVAAAAFVVLRVPLQARAPFRYAAATAGVTALVVTAATAFVKDVPYLAKQDDQNYLAAERWLDAHAQPSDVYLADNTIWLHMVEHGHPRERVIWFYKLDLDPAVLTVYPRGWRDVDYVVTSSIMDVTRPDLPQTDAAVRAGTSVAEFGDVHILRVNGAE